MPGIAGRSIKTTCSFDGLNIVLGVKGAFTKSAIAFGGVW
jgi:hypothetical protein